MHEYAGLTRFSSNLQMCGRPTTEHLRYVTLTVIHPVPREPHLLDELVDLGNCLRQIVNSLHSALMSVI